MAEDKPEATSPAPSRTDSSVASRLEFLHGLKESVSAGRLGYDWEHRFIYGGLTSFGGGFLLGGVLGMRLAGMRFLAENAHRMPTSSNGWYLYHRAKNRYRLYEGLREGTRMGARITPLVLLFFGVEEVIDTWRVELGKNNTDALASTAAGLMTAAVYSLSYQMPLPTATRMLKTGFFAGAGYGLTQDLLSSLQGNPPNYVVVIKRFIHGANQDESAEKNKND